MTPTDRLAAENVDLRAEVETLRLDARTAVAERDEALAKVAELERELATRPAVKVLRAMDCWQYGEAHTVAMPANRDPA